MGHWEAGEKGNGNDIRGWIK